MTDHVTCTSVSYKCAHCKLISIGNPAETVLVNDQELTMCCLGCVYAAEMLLCLHDIDEPLKAC